MKRTLIALTAVLTLLTAGVARAEFGPGATLVSSNPARAEQADNTVQAAAISEDGRYVVFQTNARNLYAADDAGDPPGQVRVGGIFRRDLTTGTLELVAYGNLQSADGTALSRGAQNPSVSADGRYVSFSSGWRLVPADTNPNVDVYVRDMTLPASSPDAYRLATAKDGGTVPASWGSTALASGAEVTPGTSISADGTKVLFRTGVASDLPNASDTSTPSGQLFVRDLSTNTTTLVTRKVSDGSPAGGALGQPASLSADGTTVAWPGLNASQQTTFLPAETPNDQQWRYYLWRRIADGPDAPTRRITGAVDLDDPQCTDAERALYNSGLPDATGPCYGLFIGAEGSTYGDISGKRPSLSADGYDVAFLSATPRRGTQSGFFVPDLYLTDMRTGMSRKQGTSALTAHLPFGGSAATDADIPAIAMSSDGRRLALITLRTTFLLQSPHLVGPPLPIPEFLQVYVVDLDRGEIQLASRGLDQNGANGNSSGFPSLSGDGKRLAFVSGATNLFTGDANGVDDAFVVSDGTDSATSAASGEPPFSGYSSPTGGGGSGSVKLKLSSSHGKHSTRLRVRVPAAGAVTATARFHKSTVARRSAVVGSAGTATLVLRPKTRFRNLLRRRGSIRATVTVRFTPRTPGPSLTTSQHITFKR